MESGWTLLLGRELHPNLKAGRQGWGSLGRAPRRPGFWSWLCCRLHVWPQGDSPSGLDFCLCAGTGDAGLFPGTRDPASWMRDDCKETKASHVCQGRDTGYRISSSQAGAAGEALLWGLVPNAPRVFREELGVSGLEPDGLSGACSPCLLQDRLCTSYPEPLSREGRAEGD